MKKYVINILFDLQCKHILMIEKNRPDFLAGLYNFIGGKLEDEDATELDAAVRETYEETSVLSSPHYFGTIQSTDFIVYVFRDFTDNVFDYKTMEDEPIHLLTIEDAFSICYMRKAPSNVSTLIEAAMNLPNGVKIDILE